MATECDPPGQPCILVIDDDADLVAFLFSVLVEERLSIVAARRTRYSRSRSTTSN
jgi:hypothetical protein